MPHYLFALLALVLSCTTPLRAADPAGWVVLRTETDQDLTNQLPSLIQKQTNRVTVYFAPLTDQGFAKLAELPNLEELWVLTGKDTKISGKGFAALAGLTKLKKLRFSYYDECHLPSEIAQGIAKLPNLETLEMPYGTIDDGFAAELSPMKHLKSLTLGQSFVECPQFHMTDKGAFELAKLTGLETLDLSIVGKYEFSAGSIARLGALPQLTGFVLGRNLSGPAGQGWSSFQKLEKLHVGENDLDEDAAKAIAALPSLHSLNVSYHGTTERELALLSHSASLQTLEFEMGERFGPAGWLHFKDFPALKSLTVEYVGVGSDNAPTTMGDEAVLGLGQAKGLVELNVSFGGKVKAASLAALSGLTALRKLNLTEVSTDDLSFLVPLTELRSLRLGHGGQVSLAALKTLGSLKSLRLLDLGWVVPQSDDTADVTEVISAIAALPHLLAVNLDGMNVKDRHVAMLVRNPELHALFLGHTKVTTDSLDGLLALPATAVVELPFAREAISPVLALKFDRKSITLLNEAKDLGEILEDKHIIFGDW